jgi:hypothetical protein
MDRGEWEDGIVVCAPEDMRDAAYFGPVAMPAAVASRFAATRLNRLTPPSPAPWESWLGLS